MTNIGKLHPAVKNAWLTALRSGDFPQTTGRLHDKGGFCCLGVLCEVAVREGVLAPEQVENDPFGDGVVQYGGERAMPPRVVVDWAYLVDPDEEWAVYSGPHGDLDLDYLPGLNDEGVPFTEIADIIETSL